MYALKCDITEQQSVQGAFQWIEQKLGGVHVLVNNAGCGRCTTLLSEEDNADKLRTVIDTNIMGLLLCTKAAVRLMNEQNDMGLTVNINSIKGHSVPFVVGQEPNTNIYAGTKHAVRAATEILRQELVNTKIRVSVRENFKISETLFEETSL
jgi:NADP+-dependent farnesol dehydrogenase